MRHQYRKGGESGDPAIVPGKPDESLLVEAVRHESFEMPPKAKLSDETVADFGRRGRVRALPRHDPAVVLHEHPPAGVAEFLDLEAENVAVEGPGPLEVGYGEGSKVPIEVDVTEHVQPALAQWLKMLEDYAAHARVGDGIGDLDDGETLYRHYIHAWTTIVEDPAAVHEYGLVRLAEIERQETEIATDLGDRSILTRAAAGPGITLRCVL